MSSKLWLRQPLAIRKTALWLLCLLGALWAVRFDSHWATLIFVLKAVFCVVAALLIQKSWNQAGLNPLLSWYEGFPRAIPEMNCQVNQCENLAKVSRIDHKGVFIFNEVLKLTLTSPCQLTFRFRGKSFSCEAKPRRLCRQDKAIGLRFRSMKMDQKKELGDFIEHLKGAGYV